MRTVVYGGTALAVAAAAAGLLLTGSASSAPGEAQRPAAPVSEQNLDENGLIRVHEQGTANVRIDGTPSVSAQQSGPWTVGAQQSGDWSVGITGTPSVSAQQSGPWSIGISGTPTVGLDSAATAALDDIRARLAAIEGSLGSGGATPLVRRGGFSTLSHVPAGGTGTVNILGAAISVAFFSEVHDDGHLKIVFIGPDGPLFSVQGGGDRNLVVTLPAPVVVDEVQLQCGSAGPCELGWAFLGPASS